MKDVLTSEANRILSTMLGVAEFDLLDTKSNVWRTLMLDARALLNAPAVHDDVPNIHAVAVKVLPHTNTKPTRIALTSQVFPNDRVRFSYDSDNGQTPDQAVHWLRTHGFNVCGMSASDVAVYVFTSTRERLQSRAGRFLKHTNKG